MQEFDTASDRISRIIKVIDEIAFQTDILALNAAVEAARTGEAGPDSAGMIEESIGKSGNGSAKLNQVAEVAAKVKSPSDAVDLGSREQIRGLDQIAQTISQMERVAQGTAASEQLSSHANTMRAAATKLRALADRGTPDKVHSAPRPRRKASPASNGSRPAAANRGKPKSPFSRLLTPSDGGESREF